jgi:nitroreductase
LNTNADFQDHYAGWLEAIKIRRSRRRYAGDKTIPADVLAKFSGFSAAFRPYPCARACLVTESPDGVFKGAIGPYGKIKNAPAFIAFVGDLRDPRVQEAVGYTGEGIVLEATSLGLSTCWVGGFFNADVVASLVELDPNEKVLAVTPVGYARQAITFEEQTMTGFGFTHRRKPLADLVTGLPPGDWPEWVKPCLEAVRQAPSAVNRQPWGFRVGKDAITVYVRTGGPEFSVAKRLDCGIAMLHIEVAARHLGLHGSWESMEAPLVAKFSV